MAALLLYHTDCGTHDNLFLCSYMQFLNLYILLRLHTLQICFFSSTIAIRNRMIIRQTFPIALEKVVRFTKNYVSRIH